MTTYKRLGLRMSRTGDKWTVTGKIAGNTVSFTANSGVNKGVAMIDCLRSLADSEIIELVHNKWTIKQD